ncbi:MAG: hypothetical protein ACR2OC_11875, partial [Solirubrobacterales bacterium]
MRNALNKNPVVQAVVIGIMALLVAFLLFTRVLNQGGDEAAPADPAATATPAATDPATGAVAPAPAAANPAPAAPSAPVPVTPAPSSAPVPAGDPATAFVPGPGLPEDVVVAYARNKTIALLILKRRNPERKPPSARSADDRALRLNSLPAEVIGKLSGNVEFIT